MSASSPYPLCRHILPSGARCHSPALKGKPLCYYHSRHRLLIDTNRYRQRSVALPPLEDRGAIQMSINEVVAAFSAQKIDRREASFYMWAIQTASQNLARVEDLASPQAVRLVKDHAGDVLFVDESSNPAEETTLPGQDEPVAAQDSMPGGESSTDIAPLTLHLDEPNNCDTHEYDSEPPDNRPPTRRESERLKAIQQRINTCRVADEFYERERIWKEERNQKLAQERTQDYVSPSTNDPDSGAAISPETS